MVRPADHEVSDNGANSTSGNQNNNMELCLVGQVLPNPGQDVPVPYQVPSGDFIVGTPAADGSVTVAGGHWGRGIRRDLPDGGSHTVYATFGVAITRDSLDRITSARTKTGQEAQFTYAEQGGQPTSCEYLNVRSRSPRSLITLNQETGEFSITNTHTGNRSVHNLNGGSLEMDSSDNIRMLTNRTQGQDGALLRQVTYPRLLENGMTQWEQLNSWDVPQGIEMEIPGLSREQVQRLRADSGLLPLGPNEPATWTATVTSVHRNITIPDRPGEQHSRCDVYTMANGQRFIVHMLPYMNGVRGFWWPQLTTSPADRSLLIRQ